jgi:hypothetical protein
MMILHLNISMLTSSLLLLVVINVSYRLFRHYSSKLASIPGPFLARFSRFWLLRETYYGRFHLKDVELHRKHGGYPPFDHILHLTNLFKGPVIRIAPGQYSIDDPNSVQTIYGSKGGFIKVRWFPEIITFGSDIFSQHSTGPLLSLVGYMKTSLRIQI